MKTYVQRAHEAADLLTITPESQLVAEHCYENHYSYQAAARELVKLDQAKYSDLRAENELPVDL